MLGCNFSRILIMQKQVNWWTLIGVVRAHQCVSILRSWWILSSNMISSSFWVSNYFRSSKLTSLIHLSLFCSNCNDSMRMWYVEQWIMYWDLFYINIVQLEWICIIERLDWEGVVGDSFHHHNWEPIWLHPVLPGNIRFDHGVQNQHTINVVGIVV